MANERDEVTIREPNGKEYTLVLNTSAIVKLEELFSTPTREATWKQVWERILSGSVRHIRALLWAMAQKHHPTLTLADTCELIDRLGGLEGLALDAVKTQAFMSSTPHPEDVKALGVNGNGRPRKAQA